MAEGIVIFDEDYYGRKPGDPKGHDGRALQKVDLPDVQVMHQLEECEVCKNHLNNEVAGQIERRQVYNLPDLKLLVTKHQVESKGMKAFVADSFGHKMSSGTVCSFRKEAFESLSGFEDGLKAVLTKAKVARFDETGLGVDMRGMWEVYAPRGREAMDAIGILSEFKGILVHDFWKPYYAIMLVIMLCVQHIYPES